MENVKILFNHKSKLNGSVEPEVYEPELVETKVIMLDGRMC